MKKLFKLSTTYIMQSLIPIILWYFIGFIFKNKDYSQAFTLTYPFQFVYGIIFSFLILGSAKYDLKEKNKDFNNSKTIILIGYIIFLLISIFCIFIKQDFCNYFNVSIDMMPCITYGLFCLSSDVVLCGISTVLIYQGKEEKALKQNILMYIIRFSNILAFAILSKFVFSDSTAFYMAAFVQMLFGFILYFTNFQKFSFDFWKGFKYEIASCPTNIAMFIIYFFGYHNTSQTAGMLEAYNVAALCTDTQWDVDYYVLDTAATKSCACGEYEKQSKKHIFNAVLYSFILVIIGFLAVILSGFFFKDVNIKVSLTVLLIEFMWLPFYGVSYTMEAYLKLNWEHMPIYSSIIQTSKYILRIILTFSINSEYALSIACMIVGFVSFAAYCSAYIITRKASKAAA